MWHGRGTAEFQAVLPAALVQLEGGPRWEVVLGESGRGSKVQNQTVIPKEAFSFVPLFLEHFYVRVSPRKQPAVLLKK